MRSWSWSEPSCSYARNSWSEPSCPYARHAHSSYWKKNWWEKNKKKKATKKKKEATKTASTAAPILLAALVDYFFTPKPSWLMPCPKKTRELKKAEVCYRQNERKAMHAEYERTRNVNARHDSVTYAKLWLHAKREIETMKTENEAQRISMEAKCREDIDYAVRSATIPKAKFRCGQTILQYWARWFKTEPEESARTSASGKDRAKWYIGEVKDGPDYICLVYAGVRVLDHWYHIH